MWKQAVLAVLALFLFGSANPDPYPDDYFESPLGIPLLLSGSFAERTRASLAAGCDVILHCNGERAEMDPILAETPTLSGPAAARASAALASKRTPDDFDPAGAEARLNELMKDAAHV